MLDTTTFVEDTTKKQYVIFQRNSVFRSIYRYFNNMYGYDIWYIYEDYIDLKNDVVTHDMFFIYVMYVA